MKMFTSQTNGKDENDDITFNNRYQAGDMKDDEEEEEEMNYNSYLFRFGRALMYHDKQQMIKEANEKWSSESYVERKSPTKVKFSDVVIYVEPSDKEESEEESEENEHVEEDFETFTSRLFDDIVTDLQRLPDKVETTPKVEVKDEPSDCNKSQQSKESKLCVPENHIKDKNDEIDLKSLKTVPPNRDVTLLNSCIPTSNNISDGYLRKSSSLITSPKCEKGVSVPLPLNQSKRDKLKILFPENNHTISLQMESQKDVYGGHLKESNVLKKLQQKRLIIDSTHLEPIPNDLTCHNEEQKKISNNHSFLETYVKQKKKETRKKADASTGIERELEMKSNNLNCKNDESPYISDNNTILNIYYKQIKKKSDISARGKTKGETKLNILNNQNEELFKVSNKNSFKNTSVKQDSFQTKKKIDVYTENKTHAETKSSNLNSVNEESHSKITVKNSLLIIHAKKNNLKKEQKFEISTDNFSNVLPSKLMGIDENIIVTTQPCAPNQLETKKKSKIFSQKCNVSKSKSKKNKVDSEQITTNNIDLNITKQTKMPHKLQSKAISKNNQEMFSKKSIKVKTKQLGTEIFPDELKLNSNKPSTNNILLITTKLEQNTFVESKNVSSTGISTLNINRKPKKSCIELLKKNNPTTTNFNTKIEKHITDKQMSNCGEILKHKLKALPTKGVKSSDLKLQNGPSKSKKKKSTSKKDQVIDSQK